MNDGKGLVIRNEHPQAKLVQVLSEEERLEVHAISHEAFEDLSTSSLLYQGATFEQMEQEFDNPSIKKVLLKQSSDRKSPTLGYLGIHTTFETLTWLDASKLDALYGEALSSGTFAYCSTVEIAKNARSLRSIMALLGEGLSQVHIRAQSLGEYAVMGFDCCSANDPAIPMLMQKTANKFGFGYTVHPIGRHDWVRLTYAENQDRGTESNPSNGEYGVDLSGGHGSFEIRVITNDNLQGFSPYAHSRIGNFAHISGYGYSDQARMPEEENQISLIASHLQELGSVILDIDASCLEQVIKLRAALENNLSLPIALEISDYQLYSGITKG